MWLAGVGLPGDDRTVRVRDGHGVPVGDPLTGRTGAVRAVAVGRSGGRDVIVSAGRHATVQVLDGHGVPGEGPTPLLAEARAVAMRAEGVVVAAGSALCLFDVSRP